MQVIIFTSRMDFSLGLGTQERQKNRGIKIKRERALQKRKGIERGEVWGAGEGGVRLIHSIYLSSIGRTVRHLCSALFSPCLLSRLELTEQTPGFGCPGHSTINTQHLIYSRVSFRLRCLTLVHSKSKPRLVYMCEASKLTETGLVFQSDSCLIIGFKPQPWFLLVPMQLII